MEEQSTSVKGIDTKAHPRCRLFKVEPQSPEKSVFYAELDDTTEDPLNCAVFVPNGVIVHEVTAEEPTAHKYGENPWAEVQEEMDAFREGHGISKPTLIGHAWLPSATIRSSVRLK